MRERVHCPELTYTATESNLLFSRGAEPRNEAVPPTLIPSADLTLFVSI
jgi:hypothetical protein